MRKIDTLSLKPGLRVARTIFGSDKEILLNEGTILTGNYIEKLNKYGVESIYVYIDDPITFDETVKDVISQKTRSKARKQIKKVLLETKETGKLIIEPQQIYNTVNNLAGELLSSKSLMLNLVDLREQDDYTFAHSVNVCVLSLMTGITMGYNDEKLAELGMGAMLHDIGKVKIPDEILNKPGKLTSEEFSIIQQHTAYGYHLIRDSKLLEEVTAIIALQHHENYDGSGYPLKIGKDRFHEYAQITAIADRFDALTADRVYRRPFPSNEAYEMCAGAGNYYFKDRVVKAFLHNIAAYPSGTIVELNNKEIGIVIDTPRGYGFYPRIKVLYDANYQPLPAPKEISLVEEKGIFIARVISEADEKSLWQK